MCLAFLVHARYFIAGLIIYSVPGLVFYAWALSTYSRHGEYYFTPLFFIFLFFFIATVLAIPPMSFLFVDKLIPTAILIYFIIMYGCLILHSRRSRVDVKKDNGTLE